MITSYKTKTQKLSFYTLFFSIIIPLMCFASVHLKDMSTSFDDWNTSLNILNLILGIITLSCCSLYYYLDKNKNFYLLTLNHISFFTEYLLLGILYSHKYSFNLSTLPFIFRITVLLLILNDESKLKDFILSHKNSFIYLSFLINILIMIFEYYILHVISNTYFFILFIVSLLVYFYLTLKLVIFSKKKCDFLFTIYMYSIIILLVRRFFQLLIGSNYIPKMILLNKAFLSLAFLILLIGLYIEVKSILFEHTKLNNDVRVMSDNIKEFKELEKLRMQFFANLSHEFKTPINIIFSCIQLLSKEKKENAHSFLKHYEKYDSTMTQNCYRMIRLINNLVDITKIDSGFLKLNFANNDIVRLVEDITLSIVPYVESKGLTITFDTFIEELDIRCDSDSIERVILNLLSNSIKFTEKGGSIFVLVDVKEDWVIIKVTDDGIGIPYEIQSSVFNAFVQGDKSLTRKKEGSGIGLSLVKSIINLHGGQVKINHSSSSSGTEIEMRIPNITIPEDEINLSNKKSPINNIAEKINIEFSDIYDF